MQVHGYLVNGESIYESASARTARQGIDMSRYFAARFPLSPI
jgi:hypothetical protein